MEGAPVVASRIGGIQDQIVDGETGMLLDDPLDLAYGAAVRSLLDDPARAEALGREAKERVLRRFLGTSPSSSTSDTFKADAGGGRGVNE